MPIERSRDIDLRSPEVCAFLLDENAPLYDDKSERTPGYFNSGERKQLRFTEPTSDGLVLYSSIKRRYEVFERASNMQVSTGRTITRVDHKLKLEIYAGLLLKDGITEEHKLAVLDAFQDFDASRGDIDEVETSLIQSGVPSSAYRVFLSYLLRRTSPPSHNTEHDDAFKASVRENEVYDLRQVGRDLASCDVPDLDLDSTERVVPVPDPEIPDIGLQTISDSLSAERERDCENVVPTRHRVGTLFQYPEWKIKWVLKEIRIGPCRIMKTKLPELWTRTTKKVLYAIVISPKDAQGVFEKIFLRCLKTSTIVGGLLLLVTWGNFATALSAFKISMHGCLATNIPDAMKRCIVPELVIVTDKNPWTPV